MAERGAHVVLAELDGDRADIEAKRLSNKGLKATAIQTDVANKKSSEPWLEVSSRLGRIDGLVNNAAMFSASRCPGGRLKSLRPRDKMMEINVKGVWNVCSAVVPVMKTQGYGRLLTSALAPL